MILSPALAPCQLNLGGSADVPGTYEKTSPAKKECPIGLRPNPTRRFCVVVFLYELATGFGRGWPDRPRGRPVRQRGFGMSFNPSRLIGQQVDVRWGGQLERQLENRAEPGSPPLRVRTAAGSSFIAHEQIEPWHRLGNSNNQIQRHREPRGHPAR